MRLSVRSLVSSSPSRQLELLTTELDRLRHRRRLGDRLLVLVVGPGVCNGAAPRLHVRHPVAHDECADVYRGVEISAVAEVADRAAVPAALHRLELVDDLHRAHLWRAGE